MVLGRKLFAELVGTAMLVFFGAGVAVMMFGFRLDGGSFATGVVATAFVFGLVLMGLAYSIGPISGCHVNPAVTLGALLTGRIPVVEAVGYWVAQLVGGIVGAAILLGVVGSSPSYNIKTQGLGANGYGSASEIHASAAGAFFTEVILTAMFVYVILVVTSKVGNATIAGLAIGLTLTMVHLIGIPIDGTSVNPARSLGPALLTGGSLPRQLWVFLIAPMVGAVVAAGVYFVLYGRTADPQAEPAPAGTAVGSVPAQSRAVTRPSGATRQGHLSAPAHVGGSAGGGTAPDVTSAESAANWPDTGDSANPGKPSAME
jgi:aquaporin Z